MKKLKTLLLFSISLLLLNACDKTEPCEENHFGAVSIKNKLGNNYKFDVRYLKDSYGFWQENQAENIDNNSSYRWEEISSGDIAIWFKSELNGWTLIEERKLNDCESIELNYEDPCEYEGFGSVTINNMMDVDYEFDVTFEQDVDDDWFDNDEVVVNAGSSSQWEKVGSGDVAIWVYSELEGWKIVELIELDNCEDLELTYSSQCDLENAGSVTVTNATGGQADFDVMYDDYTNNEVTLANGESYTWETLPIGTAEVWVNTGLGWENQETVSVRKCDNMEVTINNPCALNNTGSVTVSNNYSTWWDYTVSSDGISFDEESRIYMGDSYTFENIDAGTAYIYYKDGIIVDDWTLLGSVYVTACQNSNFEHTSDGGGGSGDCESDRTAEATVVNNTGYTIIVDILNSSFLGEITLNDGQSTTYTVDADSDVQFWAKVEGGSWTYSDYYDVDVCGEFTFNWNAGKMATLKSVVTKPANDNTVQAAAQKSLKKVTTQQIIKIEAPEDARKPARKVSK